MKRFFASAILGTLALSALAQSDPRSDSIVIRGRAIEVPASAYFVPRGELRQFQGSYDLSTGEAMRLRHIGSKLEAMVGEAEPKRLVPAARNVFVSSDGQMKLVLTRQDDGYVGTMWRVRNPEIATRAGAAARFEPVRIASAR